MENTHESAQTDPEVLRRREWLSSAYEMLDWISENPEYTPKGTIDLYLHYWPWDYSFSGSTDEQERDEMLGQMRVDAAVLRHHAPFGSVHKIDNDYSFGVYREFMMHRLHMMTTKTMSCEMVPTGETTEVVEYIIPDEVREKYRVVTEEPVMKRVCPPITLRKEL